MTGDSGTNGLCLKCTASALIALALGAWLLLYLVRTVRGVVARGT